MTVSAVHRFGMRSVRLLRINREFRPSRMHEEREFLSGVPIGVTSHRRDVSVNAGLGDQCRFADRGSTLRRTLCPGAMEVPVSTDFDTLGVRKSSLRFSERSEGCDVTFRRYVSKNYVSKALCPR